MGILPLTARVSQLRLTSCLLPSPLVGQLPVSFERQTVRPSLPCMETGLILQVLCPLHSISHDKRASQLERSLRGCASWWKERGLASDQPGVWSWSRGHVLGSLRELVHSLEPQSPLLEKGGGSTYFTGLLWQLNKTKCQPESLGGANCSLSLAVCLPRVPILISSVPTQGPKQVRVGSVGSPVADGHCSRRLPPQGWGSAHASSPGTDSQGKSGRWPHWEALLCDSQRQSRAVGCIKGEAQAGSQERRPCSHWALCARGEACLQGRGLRARSHCLSQEPGQPCLYVHPGTNQGTYNHSLF